MAAMVVMAAMLSFKLIKTLIHYKSLGLIKNSKLKMGKPDNASVDGDDHLITYFDASEQASMEIYWNAADGSGYLIAPNYNGGVKSCWDANQQDVACG